MKTLVRIFSLEIKKHDFTDKKWDAYLSVRRREQAKKHRNKHEQQLFLAAEVLLNRSLELIGTGISLPVSYKNNQYGKPYLIPPCGIYVNWSHSGEYVLCGVSDQEIGVDLQSTFKTPSIRLIQKVLQPEEKDIYNFTPEQEKKKLFYQFWTIKESFLKALGTGFHTPLNQFYIDMVNGQPKIEQKINKKIYYCKLLDFVNKDYVAAVCCDGDFIDPKIEYLDY